MLRTLAIGLLGIVLVHFNVAAQTPQEQEKILRAFQMNVADYTEQHNSFDLIPSAPAAATVASRIFTMPVATVFRQLIARTLDEQVHGARVSVARLFPVAVQCRPQAVFLEARGTRRAEAGRDG